MMKGYHKVLAAAVLVVTLVVLGAMSGEHAPAEAVVPAPAIDCGLPIDADAARHCERLRILALEAPELSPASP